MTSNMVENLGSVKINKTLKAGTARLLSFAVIAVLFCSAFELQTYGASIRQHLTKPEQTSESRAGHQHSSPVQSAQKQKGDLMPAIPDVEAVNQDGERVRFYSDLIKDKVVVISFVFTTCSFICPMQGNNLSKLQALLGARLGKEVNIIFVSTDPETDTPERLKAWGIQLGAKPGWTFITGKKSEIDKVAIAFTGTQALKGEHSPVVFIGSDKTGIWIRTYGLADPIGLNKLIEEITKASLN